MSIFEEIAKKYNPDEKEGLNKSIGGGDIFTDIAQESYKQEKENEIPTPLGRGELFPETSPAETMTRTLRQKTQTRGDLLRQNVEYKSKGENTKELIDKAQEYSDQLSSPELEDVFYEPLKEGETFNKKKRLKTLLNNADTQDEIDVIRKATKYSKLPQPKWKNVTNDQYIADIERRDGEMDETDKMFKQREEEIDGAKEVQPIEHYKEKAESPKLKAPTEEDFLKKNNKQGPLGKVSEVLFGKLGKRKDERENNPVESFLKDKFDVGLSKREKPQRYTNPKTGEVEEVAGLAPEDAITWVRGPFEKPVNATPVKKWGAKHMLSIVPEFISRVPEWGVQAANWGTDIIRDLSKESQKALGVPKKYQGFALEDEPNQPGSVWPFDPQRAGVAKDRIYKDDKGRDRVLTPAHWFWNRKEKMDKVNPPDSPVDKLKNTAYAGLQTVVGDVLDIYVAGKWLQAGATYALKKTGYNPQLEYDLKRLGVKRKNLTNKRLVKAVNDKVQNASHPQEVRDTISSAARIMKRGKKTFKPSKLIRPKYKSWSMMNQAERYNLLRNGKLPEPSMWERGADKINSVDVSSLQQELSGLQKSIQGTAKKVSLPLNRWGGGIPASEIGTYGPSGAAKIESGQGIEYMYGGLHPNQLSNAINSAEQGVPPEQIAKQLNVPLNAVDIAISAGGPKGLKALQNIIDQDLNEKQAKEVINQLPDKDVVDTSKIHPPTFQDKYSVLQNVNEDIDSSKQYKEEGVKPFHSVKLDDLDKIGEAGNKIIAPSFGLAKSSDAIDNYGDIAFVPPEKMLKESDLFSRDIWSPTLKEVPGKIYGVDKNSQAYKLLKRYAGFDVDEAIKSVRYNNNPREDMRRYQIESDYNLLSAGGTMQEIADEMGIDISDEDNIFKLEQKLTSQLFPEKEQTPENISSWLKGKFGDEMTGVGSIHPSVESSAEGINFDNLKFYADNKLTDKALSREEISDIQDAQLEARNFAMEELGLDQKHSLHHGDAIGKLAKSKNLDEFKSNVEKIFNYSDQKTNEILNKDDETLEKVRTKLRDAYVEVPTDYFEAKSLDAYHINQFPAVVTQNQEAIDKLNKMGYQGEIMNNWGEFYNKMTAEPEPEPKLERKTPSKEETEDVIQGLEDYSRLTIKNAVRKHISAKMAGVTPEEFSVNDMKIIGSRTRGTAKEDSDLDVLVEYEGSAPEDGVFNNLNENAPVIEGIKVDINPIKPSDSGTIEEYLSRKGRKEYLADQAKERMPGISKELQPLAKEAKQASSLDEFMKDNLVLESLVPTEREIGVTLSGMKFTGKKADTELKSATPLKKSLEEARQTDARGGDGRVGNYYTDDIEGSMENGRITVYHGTTQDTADEIGGAFNKLKEGSYLSLTEGADEEALGVYGAEYYANQAREAGEGGRVLKFEIPTSKIAVDDTTGELRFSGNKTQTKDFYNRASRLGEGVIKQLDYDPEQYPDISDREAKETGQISRRIAEKSPGTAKEIQEIVNKVEQFSHSRGSGEATIRDDQKRGEFRKLVNKQLDKLTGLIGPKIALTTTDVVANNKFVRKVFEKDKRIALDAFANILGQDEGNRSIATMKQVFKTIPDNYLEKMTTPKILDMRATGGLNGNGEESYLEIDASAIIAETEDIAATVRHEIYGHLALKWKSLEEGDKIYKLIEDLSPDQKIKLISGLKEYKDKGIYDLARNYQQVQLQLAHQRIHSKIKEAGISEAGIISGLREKRASRLEYIVNENSPIVSNVIKTGKYKEAGKYLIRNTRNFLERLITSMREHPDTHPNFEKLSSEDKEKVLDIIKEVAERPPRFLQDELWTRTLNSYFDDPERITGILEGQDELLNKLEGFYQDPSSLFGNDLVDSSLLGERMAEETPLSKLENEAQEMGITNEMIRKEISDLKRLEQEQKEDASVEGGTEWNEEKFRKEALKNLMSHKKAVQDYKDSKEKFAEIRSNQINKSSTFDELFNENEVSKIVYHGTNVPEIIEFNKYLTSGAGTGAVAEAEGDAGYWFTGNRQDALQAGENALQTKLYMKDPLIKEGEEYFTSQGTERLSAIQEMEDKDKDGIIFRGPKGEREWYFVPHGEQAVTKDAYHKLKANPIETTSVEEMPPEAIDLRDKIEQGSSDIQAMSDVRDTISWLDDKYMSKLNNTAEEVDDISKDALQDIIEETGMTPEIRRKVRELGGIIKQNPSLIKNIPDRFLELIENTSNDGLVIDNKFYPMSAVKAMSNKIINLVDSDKELTDIIGKKEVDYDPEVDPSKEEIKKIEGKIWIELDTSEAGKRIPVPSDEIGVDYKTLAKESSFPDWVPSRLRKTPLFEKVMDHMDEGTMPDTKRTKELWNVIQDEIARRASISRAKLEAIKDKPTEITDSMEKEVQSDLESILKQAKKKGEPDDLQHIIKKRTEKRATRTSDFVGRKRESTLLKDKLRNIQRGAREGRISTRREIKEAQDELTRIVKDADLRSADEAKFVKTIPTIQSTADLQDAADNINDRIKRYSRKDEKRSIRKKIKRELKYTKPVKEGSLRVGKYDYEKNKFFKKLREFSRLNQDEAQTKLDAMGIPETELEKIQARFLSYQANGMKGSLQNFDKVLDDIQQMKEAGRKAKNEEEFKKEIEKNVDIMKTYEAIASIKGDKDAISTRVENLYRRGKTDTASLFETIMGPERAEELEPGLQEIRKGVAINNTTKEIVNTISDKYNLDGLWSTLKKIKSMDAKEFEAESKNGIVEELSKWDLIDAYNAMKNDMIKERFYNAFGEEQMNELMSNLSPTEKEVGDYLMKQVQSYQEVFNQRSIELRGRDNGRVKNYWPSTSVRQTDIYDQIKKQSEIPSAIKNRAKNSKIKPKFANAFQKALGHIRQAEHVKHLSPEYERLKNIFDEDRIKSLIEKKFGKKVYQRVDDEIEKVSLQQEGEMQDLMSKSINWALNNWTTSKIVNLTTPIRQLGSFTNYMAGMPSGKFMKYFLEGLGHPKETFNFMWDNVGDYLQMRWDRGHNEATREAIQGANKLQSATAKVRKMLTVFVRMGDITPMIYGGYPKMKYELEKHGDMEKAIDSYIQDSSRHQQSVMETRRDPGQMRKGGFSRLIHRFLNYPSQMMRQTANSIINYRNGNASAGELGKKIANYNILQPLIYVLLGGIVAKEGFEAIGREFRDQEKDIDWGGYFQDAAQMAMVSPVAGIPLVSNLSKYGYRKLTGRNTYGVFGVNLIDEVGTGLQKVTKNNPDGKDLLEGFASLQEPLFPIPTRNMIRYHDYFMGIGEEKAEMKPFYNRVQDKIKQGKEDEAQMMVDSLSEDEYKVYKNILRDKRAKEMEHYTEQVKPIREKTKKLVKEGKQDKAQEIVDNLSDKEYEAYKKLLDREEEKEKAGNGIIPKSITDPDLKSDDHIIAVVSAYAQAIGTDPETAFQTMFTDEKLRKLENGTVIIQRMPFEESQKLREKRLSERGSIEGIDDLTKLELDHIVPLQLGGDNSKDNLELIPEAKHEEYTEVGNHLGELLRDDKISGDKAQELIKEYKKGRLPAEEIMNR